MTGSERLAVMDRLSRAKTRTGELVWRHLSIDYGNGCISGRSTVIDEVNTVWEELVLDLLDGMEGGA